MPLAGTVELFKFPQGVDSRVRPQALASLHFFSALVLEGACEILKEIECVCFHMTDVPYGRGGSPLQNLIVRGHRETRLTALRMTSELDAGPVYLKRNLSLEGGAEEIYLRASALSAEMIQQIVRDEMHTFTANGRAGELQAQEAGRKPDRKTRILWSNSTTSSECSTRKAIPGRSCLMPVTVSSSAAPPCTTGESWLTFISPTNPKGRIPKNPIQRTESQGAEEMSVLVVAAHPDDEILGCGGTIARLAREGHEVRIAILAEGISSRYAHREDADPGQLQHLHAQAQQAGQQSRRPGTSDSASFPTTASIPCHCSRW